LHQAIVHTVDEVTRLGGRHDEVDLLGNAGGYRRKMHSKAAGQPCPVCGTTVEKMQYLGGSCYVCPTCQI
jgi:formamidopyrimidine-DNA glycosylase